MIKDYDQIFFDPVVQNGGQQKKFNATSVKGLNPDLKTFILGLLYFLCPFPV